MTTSVFLPASAEDLRGLASAPLAERVGYAATPALLAALGYGPDEVEDAGFAAMLSASVAALTRQPYRLVLAAAVPTVDDLRDDAGACRVPGVTRAQVTALYVDEPEAAPAVAAAHAAVAGMALAEAWDDAAVQALLEAHDLLWYDAAEADAVVEMLEG